MVSKSLFKSLAVKSLRMGWPAGLEAAMAGLTPSVVRGLLWSGVFEDVFPLPTELQDVAREIDALDFDALCARQTHHGQGLAGPFADLEDAASKQAYGPLYRLAKAQGAKLAPNCAHLFWTWLELGDQIVGGTRDLDGTPWKGIPLACVDAHTREGRERDQRCTVLSGFYSQHRRLGELVMSEGWHWVRCQVHAQGTIEVRMQLSMEECMAR